MGPHGLPEAKGRADGHSQRVTLGVTSLRKYGKGSKPVGPPFQKLRQEDHDFGVSLGYRARRCLRVKRSGKIGEHSRVWGLITGLCHPC